MSAAVDLAIVGAGPAGMAAAATAAELGLSVIVLDEQPEPGGQIYRGIERLAATRPKHLELLGPDYAAGLELTRAFRKANVDYCDGAQVWQIEPQAQESRVFYKRHGAAGILNAKKILIAPGAMERPMPVPGWTLPGVMTCGAGQTMLKAHGLAPDAHAHFVLAGCGPLLLLLAAQLTRAGIKPAAILETTTNRWAALPHLPGFLAASGYLGKGLALLRELKSASIPMHKGVTRLAIKGDTQAREIEFMVGGATHRAPVDAVFLHQGVVPNGNLAWSMNLAHEWHEAQRCFHPKLDGWGRSSNPSVLIAGDAGGIVGAQGAAAMGQVTAFAAAADLGKISHEECTQRARAAHATLSQHRAARPFLDALYRPAQHWIAPPDADTVVCRCEEIRAGEIRDLVTRQQCPGPNQMKSFVRCGMGPCQGRLCGLTVVEMIAECRHVPLSEVGYYRIRSPIKPVTVGDMAAMDVAVREDAVGL
jgi:NADPH-dependent 2,4-dienoyl-CoA reductase/sulfur reductase-like enzyme